MKNKFLIDTDTLQIYKSSYTTGFSAITTKVLGKNEWDESDWVELETTRDLRPITENINEDILKKAHNICLLTDVENAHPMILKIYDIISETHLCKYAEKQNVATL